jgi:hypothetical protein
MSRGKARSVKKDSWLSPEEEEKNHCRGQNVNKSLFLVPSLPVDHPRYYGISSTWVDWTSMIYMILYIPLVFPGSWILDKLVSNLLVHVRLLRLPRHRETAELKDH